MTLAPDPNATVLGIDRDHDGYILTVHLNGGIIRKLFAGNDPWFAGLSVGDQIHVGN